MAFDLFAQLRSGPILEQHSEGYQLAESALRFKLVLERLRGNLSASGPLDASDLPFLFVGSLARPEIAENLPHCADENEGFWRTFDVVRALEEMGESADPLSSHPVWIPVYAEFIRSLPRSRSVTSEMKNAILRPAIGAPALQLSDEALVLALFRNEDVDDPAEVTKRVDSVIGTGADQYLSSQKRYGEYKPDVGAVLARAALLAVVVGSPKAEQYANNALEALASKKHEDGSEGNLLWRSDGIRTSLGGGCDIWALVLGLLDRLDVFERYYPAMSRAEVVMPPLAHVLCFPQVGGEAFLRLNRQVCRDIANWCYGPSRRRTRQAEAAGAEAPLGKEGLQAVLETQKEARLEGRPVSQGQVKVNVEKLIEDELIDLCREQVMLVERRVAETLGGRDSSTIDKRSALEVYLCILKDAWDNRNEGFAVQVAETIISCYPSFGRAEAEKTLSRCVRWMEEDLRGQIDYLKRQQAEHPAELDEEWLHWAELILGSAVLNALGQADRRIIKALQQSTLGARATAEVRAYVKQEMADFKRRLQDVERQQHSLIDLSLFQPPTLKEVVILVDEEPNRANKEHWRHRLEGCESEKKGQGSRTLYDPAKVRDRLVDKFKIWPRWDLLAIEQSVGRLEKARKLNAPQKHSLKDFMENRIKSFDPNPAMFPGLLEGGEKRAAQIYEILGDVTMRMARALEKIGGEGSFAGDVLEKCFEEKVEETSRWWKSKYRDRPYRTATTGRSKLLYDMAAGDSAVGDGLSRDEKAYEDETPKAYGVDEEGNSMN